MAKKQTSAELQAKFVEAFDHWAISDEAKRQLAKQFESELPTEDDVPVDRVSKLETPKRRLQNDDSKTETPNQSIQIGDSKTETLKRRLQNDDSGAKTSSLQERTFQNKLHVTPSPTAAELRDNIPKRLFFRYYNALHDIVLPQLPRNSRLILCVMFRKSHGFNRNWCSISLRELVYATGMGENTVRRSLAPLINDSWVVIAGDGYREATTYVLKIPIKDTDKEGEAKEEEEEESPNWSLQNGDSNLEGRVSKLESPEWQPCTSSTSTGQSTVQKPGSHPEVQRNSVQPEEIEEVGKNRVDINPSSKHLALFESPHPLHDQTPVKHYLSETEEAYVSSCPSLHQSEIFDAQDAWDQIIGASSRPAASKLNEMLGHLREFGYKGGDLNEKFRMCLERTKGRAKDPVAWMISALKSGRYP